ncbi:MAG: DUF4325 domain-containing protein [Betaproteobacteria bacterium]|nr:DUF4325 domain-containing protein [Betaproteobacteria bacterium]
MSTEGERLGRKGKRIFVNALETHEDLGTLAKLTKWILHNPQTNNVILYFPRHFRVFPNAVSPLACMIDYLRHLGVKVTIHNDVPELAETNFDAPLVPSEESIASASIPSGVVWKYSSPAEVASLLDVVLDYLSRKLVCEGGVLLALEWCIGEMLDNVFQHAHVQSGYFMFQLQQERRRLSFCVADQGIGVLNSFSGSRYRPISAVDAITLAIQRGVTSNAECQGNGLWGASEIITQNRGQMTISSGGGAVFYNRQTGHIKNFDTVYVLDRDNPGAIVDVQLDASRSIDLLAAFHGDFEPVNLRMESLEDAQGFLVAPIKKISVGTGTRAAGRDMRCYIQNLIQDSGRPVLVDFAGVGIVSSSYADECFGKLYRDLPTDLLGERLRFSNVSPTVKLIVTNAVGMRHKG